MQHTRQKRMHGEVTTANSMIQSTINRHLIAIGSQRFQQRCLFVFFADRFGKEVFLLKAQQIADRNKPSRTNTGPRCRQQREFSFGGCRGQGRESRQCERTRERPKDKAAATGCTIHIAKDT